MTQGIPKGTPKGEAGFGYFPYKDTGCEASPTCQTCPLPQCKYDGIKEIAKAKSSARAAVIRLEVSRGKAPMEIATKVGCSERTVYRALHR